ncbi:MAG: cell division protein ZapA [Candidatus Ratteibacteria bacterium]
MYKINIFGKTYFIYSTLPSNEINKIVREINEKYRQLEQQYKTFDKVDILIVFLIELYEVIYNLKKEIAKNHQDRKVIKEKIEEIEKEIELMVKS